MTTVTKLADRNAAVAARRNAVTCPRHPGTRLDGGPVQFTCRHGHSVPAADIDHEFHAGGAA